MARKDYPWSIPDIKFGSNLVVNSILLIFVIGFYAITGVVYLIIFIIDWVKEYKSKNNPIDKEAEKNAIATGDEDKKRKKSLRIKGKRQKTTKKEKIIGALIIIGNMLALLFAILGEYGLI